MKLTNTITLSLLSVICGGRGITNGCCVDAPMRSSTEATWFDHGDNRS